MKGTVISLRLPGELLERIDACSENRTAFIREAVEEKLCPVKVELTKNEKRELLKDSKTLSDMMRDAMMQRLRQEEDILNDLPNTEFVNLVARLLPKESAGDMDIEQDVLSLKECLSVLPGTEDITKELNRVKGELYKASCERDLNLKLLRHAEGKVELSELMEEIYRRLVEYVCILVARNSLPGLGEGGGLSESGYAEISRQVKRELEKVELYRKK